MDKKDILERSRMENDFGANDEITKDVYQKSFRWACLVACTLCIVFSIINNNDKSYFVIGFSLLAASNIYKAIKLKTKSETIGAIAYSLMAVVWAVLYMLKRCNIL